MMVKYIKRRFNPVAAVVEAVIGLLLRILSPYFMTFLEAFGGLTKHCREP